MLLNSVFINVYFMHYLYLMISLLVLICVKLWCEMQQIISSSSSCSNSSNVL